MVIDGQHNGRCVSLEVLFWIGRTLYQGKRQHESFATLDGVKVDVQPIWRNLPRRHDEGGAIYERSAVM
jgi:hypothetical protein